MEEAEEGAGEREAPAEEEPATAVEEEERDAAEDEAGSGWVALAPSRETTVMPEMGVEEASKAFLYQDSPQRSGCEASRNEIGQERGVGKERGEGIGRQRTMFLQSHPFERYWGQREMKAARGDRTGKS